MLYYLIESSTVAINADTPKAAAEECVRREMVSGGTVKLVSADKVRTFAIEVVKNVAATELT